MTFRTLLTSFILFLLMQNLYALRLYTHDQYQATRNKAVIEARAGNHKSALLTLKRLLKLEPDNTDTLNDYITILIWDEQYQQALDIFSSLNLKKTPNYVLRSLALAAEKLNQNQITQKLVKTYFEKNPVTSQDAPDYIQQTTKAELALCSSKENMPQTTLAILNYLILKAENNFQSLYKQHINNKNDFLLEPSYRPNSVAINSEIKSQTPDLKQKPSKKMAPKNAPYSILQNVLNQARDQLAKRQYAQAKKTLMPLYLKGEDSEEFLHLMIQTFDHLKDYQQTAYLNLKLLNKTSQDEPEKYKTIKKQLVLNLFYAGAPYLAMTILKTEPYTNLLSQQMLNKLLVDIKAFQLRWSDYKQPHNVASNKILDKTIHSMEKTLLQLKTTDDQYNRLRINYDYLAALRERDRMQDVIKQFHYIIKHGNITQSEMPDYALNAVADAYLALKQPDTAKLIYLDILSRQPDNFPVKRSLVYAYLDMGKTLEAMTLVKNTINTTPVWRKDHSGKIIKNNNEKLQVQLLLANSYANADKLENAQQILEEMRSQAPYNVEIRDNLAQIYRWRGWPEKAFNELLIAKTIDQNYLYADINRTYTLIDNYQFSKANELLLTLNSKHPEKGSVKQLSKDWSLLNNRQFLSWFDIGDSDSKNNTNQSNYGNSDLSIESYLYDSMINHKYRPFLHQYYTEADFQEGSARYERIGIGVEYRKDRHLTSIELSDSYTARSDIGFSLQSEHHLNDYLQLVFAYNSFSKKVPVRAYFHHIDGYDASLSAQWRFDELSQINLGYEMLDYSDGNLRDSWSLSFSHRIINHPNYKMQLTPSYYQSQNSKPSGLYFAPKNDYSYSLNIRNEWHTLKERNKNLKQVLDVNIGKYAQYHYDTETTTAFSYQHEWTLSKALKFTYGLRVSRNYYDGDKEKRESAFASLNWLF